MVDDEHPSDKPPLEDSDELNLDPNGPPESRSEPFGESRSGASGAPSRWGGLPIAACFIAAGGVVMGVMENGVHSCRGATRSARLKWQEQQALIEQAVKHDAQLNADEDAAR